jgi:hypothetical protein
MKVHSQLPPFPLTLGWKEGKLLGSEEGKAMGSGLLYVVSREVSTVFDTNSYVKFGRAPHEARIAKWNMCSRSVFGLRPKEITEHFDRLGVKRRRGGGENIFRP